MAKAAYFDDAWYRVAAVRCALRGDVVVARQRFRGQPWYVVHDPLGNRSHRVSTQAWWLLSQLDGRRTVDAVWQAALAALGDDAPSQVEVVDLLGRLHAADLIRSDRPLDVGQLGRRRAKLHKPTWLRNLVSPLSVRLPMWDCDLFLERTQHMVRPLMGSVGWLMWCAWVLPAAMLALGERGLKRHIKTIGLFIVMTLVATTIDLLVGAGANEIDPPICRIIFGTAFLSRAT